jgi:sugar transferase (PEP-CTERM/EpsH1 system associated)
MLDRSDPSAGSPAKGNMVFLTQRIPYPPIKGEKIRPLQILKHFAKSYNVYLGCLIDDPQDRRHRGTVSALCADAYFGDLNRKRDNLSHAKAIATGQALSVALYDHQGLRRWTSRILQTVKPDVVFVCSSNMATYVLDQPSKGRTCIVDLADVDSEKWRSYADKASGFMKWIYKREARIVSDLERRIARETDFSTFVSEPEAALFRNLVPDRAQAIIGVPSGIEHGYFDPTSGYPAPYDARLPTFVFTGTMDYIPNVDAVCWFSDEILPLIRQCLPTAQFYVVGANPSAAARKLSKTSGVHVTGRVADVRPYLAHATAVVAPMRIARGIQNKVMEAMSMAKPVIVTSDALEGIDAIIGEELFLADDAISFAMIACKLAENPDKGVRIGAAARRRMVDHFSWEAQLRGFDLLLARSGP